MGTNILSLILTFPTAFGAAAATEMSCHDTEETGAQTPAHIICKALQRQGELSLQAAELALRSAALERELQDIEDSRLALTAALEETNALLRRAIEGSAATTHLAGSPLATRSHATAPTLARMRGQGYQTGQAEEGGVETVGQEPKQEDRPPDIAVLADQGGVLLPSGIFSIDPAVEYIRSDVRRAEIVGFTVLPGILLGDITVSEANRDTVLASLTARLGLTPRLEAEVRAPYAYRNDTITLRPLQEGADGDVTVPSDGGDLGDLEAALHFQFLQNGPYTPFLVGNLRGRAPTGIDPFEVERDPRTGAERDLPTGTGFWSIQPSLTAIWPSDPAVLFANVSYQHNFSADKGEGFGTVEPGAQIGANVGLGLSLNDRLSLNFSYDHSMVAPTQIEGVRALGSERLQIGSLLIGGSYRYAGGNLLQLTIGSGVTEDAPDLRLMMRSSLRFEAW